MQSADSIAGEIKGPQLDLIHEYLARKLREIIVPVHLDHMQLAGALEHALVYIARI